MMDAENNNLKVECKKVIAIPQCIA